MCAVRLPCSVVAVVVALLASPSVAASGASEYVDVLRVLSEDGTESALAALRSYETSAIDPQRPSASLRRLTGEELRVLRTIARRGEAEALLPIIDLHLASYLRYMDTDARFLLPHSRDLGETAIDLYLDASDGDTAPRVASRWLTMLAGNVLVGRARGHAAELLQRALVLDPDNATASLGLAAIREKEGRYEEVVMILDRYRGRPIDRPEIAEIRLRLAVNLDRGGDGGAAVRELRGVAHDSTTPAWIRTLAYQRWARLLFDLEQWQAARALLDDAVATIEGDERLLLLLAYCYERLGSPRAAADAAALVEPRVGGAEAEELRPRDRYNRYPRLLPNEGYTRQAAEDAMPILEATLDNAFGEGDDRERGP